MRWRGVTCPLLALPTALTIQKSQRLLNLRHRCLVDKVAQSALCAGCFVDVNNPFGGRLVQQLAKCIELGSSGIEFLRLNAGLQLLDGSFKGGLRSTVASAALERLAKPLLGTLDIWHVNSS